VWGPQYPGGARIWRDAQNLVELNLENPKVRDFVWGAPDSVVQSYLGQGVDGWRLDVGYDIGMAYLSELTAPRTRASPGSLVVGEIANYPKDWFPAVDGVIDFNLRLVVLGLANGEGDTRLGARMLEKIIGDAGTEPMLKSWLMLDNHDTFRLANTVPDPARRKLAQVLQFTAAGRAKHLLRHRAGHGRRRGSGNARADALGPRHRRQSRAAVDAPAGRAAPAAPGAAGRRLPPAGIRQTAWPTSATPTYRRCGVRGRESLRASR
jgi:hypothetical protein